MNLMYQEFKASVDALFSNKNITATDVATARFMADFEAHAFTRHAQFGDGLEMLALLSDSSNLFDSNKFNTNFRSNLKSFVSRDLAKNKTFQHVLQVLVGNKSKGVGIGELILPLLVAGWTRVNGSDGMAAGGVREIKNAEGASLKPVKTGLTKKGLVDDLNDQFFGGKCLGKKTHEAILKQYGDFSTPLYRDYFLKLWPTCDIDFLISRISTIGNDVNAFHSTVGRFILREYQRIDGWKSIVLIDPTSLDIVNIADVSNDSGFEHLQLNVRLSRQKDTQAVPDGYAVVKLKN